MRISSSVPAGTFTGGGGGGVAGEVCCPAPGCDPACAAAPFAASVVVAAAGFGVTVVVTTPCFCPAAGGCTTVVTVLPFLSVEVTVCGWPVLAACCFACSIAASCLDWQPVSPTTSTVKASTHSKPEMKGRSEKEFIANTPQTRSLSEPE